MKYILIVITILISLGSFAKSDNNLYSQMYLFDKIISDNSIMLLDDSLDYIHSKSSFNFEQGNYKLITDAEINRSYKLSFFGKGKLKNDKITLFGKVDSKFSFDSRVNWKHSHSNNWMDNPYQIVTNISRNWKRYFYNLQGGAIYSFDNSIKVALKLHYSPWNDYRIRDPRTTITGLELGLTPSFLYSINKLWDVGVSLSYQKLKEENLTNNKEMVAPKGTIKLMMLGYGYFNTVPENLYLYKKDSYKTSLNLNYKGEENIIYMNLNFLNSEMTVSKNYDYIKHYPTVGIYKKSNFSASIIHNKRKGILTALQEVSFQLSNGTGTSYNTLQDKQKEILVKIENYTASTMNISFYGDYKFEKLNMRLLLNSSYIHRYKRDKQAVENFEFTDITNHISVIKYFIFNSFELYGGLGISLKNNINSKLKIRAMEINNSFIKPVVPLEHEYFSSSYISPELKFGVSSNIFNHHSELQFITKIIKPLKSNKFKFLDTKNSRRLSFNINLILSL